MPQRNKPKIRGAVEPSGATGKRPLIVVLHGNRGGRDSVSLVVEVARETRQTADVWVPIMPHSARHSFVPLSETVKALKEKLDEIWSDEYRELVIIGHSTGGALARALYVAGAQQGSPWADRMLETDDEGEKRGRVVMLAGMNRGWQISHHLSLWHAILWSLGALAGHFLALFGLRLGLFDLRRGSLFLTRMRFDWLELAKRGRTPLTVQLLGTIDDLVSPDDVIDLVTGASFRYLDVPHSGHTSVLEMDESDPQGRERAAVLRIALDTERKIGDAEVLPWGLESQGEDQGASERGARKAPAIDHVVFVIHGIRDRGFWTDKIARHIWRRCDAGQRRRLERVTSSYGYFGMGPFLFPWVRRRKVEWLADQVLEARARYPEARLSYVGHSNGTYLLASALETYREIDSFSFDRVVFAGSVVPRDYDWGPVTTGDPAASVLNITATGDWVVAFFPQLFELVPIQDLGSAGHNGFTRGSPRVWNFNYARGGHGAGIDESLWDYIADFVLGVDPAPEEKSDETASPSQKALPGVRVPGSWGATLRRLNSWTPLPVWLGLLSLLFVLVPAAIVRLPDLVAGTWVWLLARWSGLAAAVRSAESLASPLNLGEAAVVAVVLAGGITGGIVAFRRTAADSGLGKRRAPLAAALVSSLVILTLAAVVVVPARFAGLALAEPASWGTALLVLYFVALVSLLKRV